MNLRDYQVSAVTTAKPTALDIRKYLAPALFSEVGELLDVFSKGHRDGHPPEQIASNAVKEYGDCYWMTAVGLHVHGINVVHGVPYYSQTRESSLQHLALQAAEVVNDDQDPDNWVEMWHRLNEGCRWVTDESPNVVLQTNILKLQDRQARNVIGGSGNAR